MTQKKYQVFVSSTFRDLLDERQDAIRNILDLKHIPAGMELFPATDINQLDYIKKVIDECDYYLLIMGGRYGSSDSEGVSYTEREYDYAVETGKIILAFVHNNPASIPVGKSDVEPKVVVSLNGFRDKVMAGRLVKTWSTRQELEPLVLKSLVHAFNDFPQVGWIRGNNAASDDLLEQSNRLLQENAKLKGELAKTQKIEQPKIENIAGLDDTFTVRYTSRGYRGAAIPNTLDLKWKQIFLAIAGFLETSKTDYVILSALKEITTEVNAGYDPMDINQTDKITIKVQLEALGLISTRVLTATNGGVAQFLSLTEKGRTQFLQDRIVRKVAS